MRLFSAGENLDDIARNHHMTSPGFEPGTTAWTARCSSNLAPRHNDSTAHSSSPSSSFRDNLQAGRNFPSQTVQLGRGIWPSTSFFIPTVTPQSGFGPKVKLKYFIHQNDKICNIKELFSFYRLYFLDIAYCM